MQRFLFLFDYSKNLMQLNVSGNNKALDFYVHCPILTKNGRFS